MIRSRWIACLATLALLLTTATATASEKVTLYMTNALGTPVAEMDAQGNVIYQGATRPYGKQALDPAQPGPGFTGHINDTDTGFVYMQARYYDPGVGRFLSVDPVPPSPGSLSGFGRYAYVDDNPVATNDPDGKCGVGDCVAIIVVAGPIIASGLAYVGGKILKSSVHSAGHSVSSSSGAVTLAAMHTFMPLAVDAATILAQHSESSPSAPKGLVGEQDGKGGQQGGRINSGPLSPEHGGTGDSEKDFDKLTGGSSRPASEGERYPPGTKVGGNGIAHRPARGKSGPRIDIPANGDKPHETLHYPKPSVDGY